MQIEEILKVDFDYLDKETEINALTVKLKELNDEKGLNLLLLRHIIKSKMELLISKTSTGELREELTELNIYLSYIL